MIKPQFKEGVEWLQRHGFVPTGPVDSAWTNWNLGEMSCNNRLAGSVWGCGYGWNCIAGGGDTPREGFESLVYELQSRGLTEEADIVREWLDAISLLES
jgi:hypothetical protein